MTDEQKPQNDNPANPSSTQTSGQENQAAQAQAPQSTTPNPIDQETDLKQRILQHQAKIQELERDIKIITGKLENRSPEKLAELKNNNEELAKRITNVEDLLFKLTEEKLRIKDKIQGDVFYESLRGATLTYCKAKNIDQKIYSTI